MDKIGADIDSVKLLIFGDGEYLARFKAENPHGTNVIFMGFRNDFLNFLATADAYVYISGLDNQPYSLIEAMMLSKVILCNNLEALVETIDPANNYLVSLDASSIHQGLKSLIADIMNSIELINAKGKQNRKFAIETYSSDAVARKYLNIYCDKI